MALFSLVAKNVTGSLAQSIGNSCMMSKDDTKKVSNFIRENTKKYWKPLAAISAVTVLAIGAVKLYNKCDALQRLSECAPTETELEILDETTEVIECGPVLQMGVLHDLEQLAQQLLEELDLEDCLEEDRTELNYMKSVLGKDLERLAEAKDGDGKNAKTIEIMEENIKLKTLRNCRKRVKDNYLGKSIKAMATKIRNAFPSPNGSELQQKAMSMYIFKECRKLHMRESDAAVLIPKAVALASIPTIDQVNVQLVTKTKSVQIRYNKRNWSGKMDKADTWLSGILAAVLPTR